MTNKIGKLLVTALMIVSPVMFTACGDDNDNTRRDGRDASDVAAQENRNDQAPNNVKDNYVKEDRSNPTSTTNENEEQSNKMMNTMRDSAAGVTDPLSNNHASIDNYNQLNERINKLEQEVIDLKSKRVGPDIVGQK